MEPQQQATSQQININSTTPDNPGQMDCNGQEQPNKAVEKIDQNASKTNNGTYHYKTISYILGSMPQISSYFFTKPSNEQKPQTQENDQISSKLIEQPTLQLEGIQASDSTTQKRKRMNSDPRLDTSPQEENFHVRPRIISQEFSLNQEQIQRVFDHSSDSSPKHASTINESGESTDAQSIEDLVKSDDFHILNTILSQKILSENPDSQNNMLVESFTVGLGGQYDLVDQIPCVSSADKTQFIVFLNQLDIKSFQKSTLFNLVQSAESVSSSCKSIIFITARGNIKSDHKLSQNYKAYKGMFEVIGAKRMLKSSIKPITKSENTQEFGQILEQYGFYKMEI